jgi:20S proteasome subunit alpha 3
LSCPACRDEHYGFQLYQSDPSGNYGGWKAVAIGAGAQAAQNLLKTEFKEETTVRRGICWVVLVSGGPTKDRVFVWGECL